MNNSAYCLTVLAASCLREAVSQAQRSSSGVRLAPGTAIEGFRAADPLAVAGTRSPARTFRLTIGNDFSAAMRDLLGRGRLRGAATAGVVRMIRSSGPNTDPIPGQRRPEPDLDDGTVREIPVDVPTMAVDRDVAVLPEKDTGRTANRPRGVVVVRDRPTLNVLVACHDLLWSAAVAGVDTSMSAPLRSLVAELATGVTDVVAARNLHLSERTVSRRMGEILDHLGAASRFQAGVLASRTGLV